MAAPSQSTCAPWATVDDLCHPCSTNYDTISLDLLEQKLQDASDFLFEATGRQYPGECETTVRPCARPIEDDRMRYPYSTATLGCGCSSVARCGCPRPSQIQLGYGPITAVSEVKVDGDVLDPSLYRVDDWKWLVRLRDPDGKYRSWPCCQDILLPDTELNTFSVTFTYGLNPPGAGVSAAAILACELALACEPVSGAECRLPKRVQQLTRQGVSMILLDPMEFLEAGRFGIPEVDQFIATYNRHGLRRTSAVLSPDFPQRVRRVGT